MKTAGIVVAALFIGVNTLAQKFDTDTIVYNGDINKLINLVILSDGYTSSELSKFVVDATNFTNAFFNEIPFSNYKKYYNVIIIKVPSNQSGASHPGTATDVTEPAHPVINVDNYFGSTFDSYNIHRLLVATRTSAIYTVLYNNFTYFDQAMILVNTPYYGGSGGSIPVASTHTESGQIAMHELEHGFAGVMDEYWAGDQYAGEWLNMTRQTDPKQVKWKNWYGVNQIGIYQHCCGGNSAQWYRPHQNCKMRYLGSPFCSVCIQATVEKIHSLTTPVESYFPLSNDITDTVYPLKFKLTLIAPTPNTLKRNWLLNDAAFKQNIDSVSINENNLLAGTNTLKAIIEDTTQFLRIDNHSKVHISTVLWLIKKGSTGVNKISSSSSQVIIELYPNPTTGNINIKLLGPPKGDIQVEIFDLQGKRQKIFSIHSNGVHSLDLHNLKRGIYLARIFIDNSLITAKKIIRE